MERMVNRGVNPKCVGNWDRRWRSWPQAPGSPPRSSPSEGKNGLGTSFDDHTGCYGHWQTAVVRCNPNQGWFHHHHYQYQWGAGRSTYNRENSVTFLFHLINDMVGLPSEHLWTETISKRLLQLMDAGVVESKSMDDNNSVFLVQRI